MRRKKVLLASPVKRNISFLTLVECLLLGVGRERSRVWEGCQSHSLWSELCLVKQCVRNAGQINYVKNMQIALFCGKSLNFSQFLLLKRVAGANVSCWLSLFLSLPYFISYTFTFQRCTRSQIGARRQMMEKTELVKDKALKRNKKKTWKRPRHTHTHTFTFTVREWKRGEMRWWWRIRIPFRRLEYRVYVKICWYIVKIVKGKWNDTIKR